MLALPDEDFVEGSAMQIVMLHHWDPVYAPADVQ